MEQIKQTHKSLPKTLSEKIIVEFAWQMGPATSH